MFKLILFISLKKHFMKLHKKINLGFFPTPIEYLRNLSKVYSDYNIFIKRDDQTGLASGGNKTRKLEFLLYDALTHNANTVITAGAQQSNHCRQTAAACAKMGLECHLLLGGEKPEIFDGNLLLSYMLGANLHFTGENRKGEDIAELKNELQNQGKNVYIIPYGGSNIIGVLGYFYAIKELKNQLLYNKLKIDYIFFATSSGGTQAGMILGKEKFKLSSELMPIQIDKEEINGLSLEQNIFNLLKDGKELFEIKKEFNEKDVETIKDYDKSGYGNMTEAEKEAILEMAKSEGIILDPVYTGRAFYGMLDILRKKTLAKNSNILFWHTGGFPANFIYSDKF